MHPWHSIFLDCLEKEKSHLLGQRLSGGIFSYVTGE